MGCGGQNGENVGKGDTVSPVNYTSNIVILTIWCYF